MWKGSLRRRSLAPKNFAFTEGLCVLLVFGDEFPWVFMKKGFGSVLIPILTLYTIVEHNTQSHLPCAFLSTACGYLSRAKLDLFIAVYDLGQDLLYGQPSLMGCNRRSAWLSVFIGLQVLGFTACLVAVVTPSWQYVYLENGRTEHHHGLWLDCKRDYLNDYGRTKEYYHTLYRLDHLQGPFDQLWLPSLLCVYKFDYWLDDEDWFEHGYDENRLQGDAYQHLFIGWKIASLTAHCFGLVCSLSAIIILFCAFCNRILICVAAVLVSLSVITVFIGNCIFYLFANYQDNNMLHEEDGDYERHIQRFYKTLFELLEKEQKAKDAAESKIDKYFNTKSGPLEDFVLMFATSIVPISTLKNNRFKQFFGWSFYSALIGNTILFFSSISGCMATSAAIAFGKTKLVKIELADQDRDQLLHSSTGTTSINPAFKRSLSAVYRIDSNALRKWEKEAMKSMQKQQFKRANSMPNIAKKSALRSSSNVIISSQSDLSSHAQTEPIDNIKLAYLDPLRSQKPISEEVIYEYVEPNSLSCISEKSAPYSTDRRPPLPKRPPSVTNLQVYDKVCDSPHSMANQEENEYLRPIQSGSSTPIGITLMKTKPVQETQFTSTILSRQQIEERFERTNLNGLYGKKLPPKPAVRSSLRALTKSTKEDSPPIVKINTFQYRDEEGRIRSLTNLSMADQVPELPNMTSFFAHNKPPTEIASSVNTDDRSSSAGTYSSSIRNRLIPGLKETSFDAILARHYAASEADRSIGSSTIFRPQSPAYELDDDKSTVSTNLSSGSNRPPNTSETMV